MSRRGLLPVCLLENDLIVNRLLVIVDSCDISRLDWLDLATLLNSLADSVELLSL